MARPAMAAAGGNHRPAVRKATALRPSVKTISPAPSTILARGRSTRKPPISRASGSKDNPSTQGGLSVRGPPPSSRVCSRAAWISTPGLSSPCGAAGVA
ncbi:hypothetical protein D3C85_1123980 [compost metagenome]